MQKGEYIVIKVADIEDKIKASNYFLDNYNPISDDKVLYDYHERRSTILQSLLTDPTDLYDVVEDVISKMPITTAYYTLNMDFYVKNYLNNLEI